MNTQQRVEQASATGFTLVEILVAFAVALLLLNAIYRIFGTELSSSPAAQHRRDALLLAQSSLDAVTGVPIGSEDTNDSIGTFQRHVEIRPRFDLMPPNARLSVLPYELQVQISWRDQSATRSVSLSTLWLEPR